jgi:Helix-hairpin-helix domain
MNPRDIQAVTRRNQGIAAALNEMADLLEIMEVNGPARGSASKAKAATPGNAKAYEAHAAPFKAKAYRTAARNVSGLNYEITAENLAEVVKSVRGVGKSIGAAIAEYVNEGQMSALQALRGNKHVKAYKFFAGILGVGPSTAAKWIRAGIYTRQALQRAASPDQRANAGTAPLRRSPTAHTSRNSQKNWPLRQGVTSGP